MMEFVVYNGMDQLPGSANALFQLGAKDSIFFSREWFENLSNTALRDVQSVLLACVVDGDRFLAILPLMRSGGNTAYSLRHRYTALYSLLLEDSDQRRILTCLAEGLVTHRVDSLLLEPVDESDSRVNGLQRSMEESGFHCHRSFRFYNWYLDAQVRSYRDYMADRPARLRNTLARKKRKLEREQGYDIRLFKGNEAYAAMSDFHAVYRASWKATEQYPVLLDGMASGFSKAGWSRLAVLYIRGQPAAAQLWFVLHGKASIFRLAYDETWRRYSPGSILTDYMMEYAIDTARVLEIDFLTGNEAYKQDWMSGRRERHALSCVKNRVAPDKFERVTHSLKRLFGRT